MLFFVDTETTGLPIWDKPSDIPEQPHPVQVAVIVDDGYGKIVGEMNVLVQAQEWVVPPDMVDIHGITTERSRMFGIPESAVCRMLDPWLRKATALVGHNVSFDMRILRIAFKRAGMESSADYIKDLSRLCTMRMAKTDQGINNKYAKGFKLEDCINHYFGGNIQGGAHDAMNDLRATHKLYWHLANRGPQVPTERVKPIVGSTPPERKERASKSKPVRQSSVFDFDISEALNI